MCDHVSYPSRMLRVSLKIEVKTTNKNKSSELMSMMELSEDVVISERKSRLSLYGHIMKMVEIRRVIPIQVEITGLVGICTSRTEAASW